MMMRKFREFDAFTIPIFFQNILLNNGKNTVEPQKKLFIFFMEKKGITNMILKPCQPMFLGAVYENYLSHRLSKSKKGTTVSKDAGKKERARYILHSELYC